jgi:hypothetical protein
VTPEERELGLELLKSPELFDRIAADMDALGYVGEELNKKLVYLAASSRKLEDPLSILILSQSASGKSFVWRPYELIPRDVIAVTSLSDPALNYIPDGELQHKFLILGEAVHSEVIEHQIREMLSGHRLSRLVVLKDEKTGSMTTKTMSSEVTVSAIMSSTERHRRERPGASGEPTSQRADRRIASQREKYTLQRYYGDFTPPGSSRHHAPSACSVLMVVSTRRAPDFPRSLIRTGETTSGSSTSSPACASCGNTRRR